MCQPQVTRWVNFQVICTSAARAITKLAISVFTGDIIFDTISNLQSPEVNLFHSAAYSQHVC